MNSRLVFMQWELMDKLINWGLCRKAILCPEILRKQQGCSLHPFALGWPHFCSCEWLDWNVAQRKGPGRLGYALAKLHSPLNVSGVIWVSGFQISSGTGADLDSLYRNFFWKEESSHWVLKKLLSACLEFLRKDEVSNKWEISSKCFICPLPQLQWSVTWHAL